MEFKFRLGFVQGISNQYAQIDEYHEEIYCAEDTIEDAKMEAFNRFHLDGTAWNDKSDDISIFDFGENCHYFIERIISDNE